MNALERTRPLAISESPARYGNDFLREVELRVEEGAWVKMCMQCGVCAGSCPFGPHWQHTPQKIFMMIRAGKRAEVLSTDSMWMCTSCYNCVVRCPRKLPITQIMHGIAAYAQELGLAPRQQPTRDFSILFWKNATRTGRVNELKLAAGLYMSGGVAAGVKTGWAMRNVVFGLIKAGRFNLLEVFGGHKTKDQKGLAAMLAKARALDTERRHPTP